MVTLLTIIASTMWGIFTAEMGHPVFRSVADFMLTIIPCACFSPAIYFFAYKLGAL